MKDKYDTYKDSGIEWLGNIPSAWEISKIGTLYTERKTKVSDVDYPPLSVTMKGIVPQLATAAKTDAHDDRKLVCVGDFAINSRSDRRGSCGGMCANPEGFLPHAALPLIKIITNEHSHPLYQTGGYLLCLYKHGASICSG